MGENNRLFNSYNTKPFFNAQFHEHHNIKTGYMESLLTKCLKFSDDWPIINVSLEPFFIPRYYFLLELYFCFLV